MMLRDEERLTAACDLGGWQTARRLSVRGQLAASAVSEKQGLRFVAKLRI